MFKKILSLLLCLALIAALVPAAAAEEIRVVETEARPNTVTLQVASMSTDGLKLKWSASSGAEFELQRLPSAFAEYKDQDYWWDVMTTTITNTYTDTGVFMGSGYLYRLHIYQNGAWTGYSNEIEVVFNPFTDIPSSGKTLEYVSWAYNSGVVKGTSKTTFSPNESCSRIQFVMMLWKMHGSREVEGTNPFKDVTGAKSVKAILWALSVGAINSGKTFNPDGEITRVQIVMILWKLRGSPEVEGTLPFTDVSGAKTTKAVLWAYKNGITTGISDTKFGPDQACTRVQLVVFLYRYYNKFLAIN